MSTKNTTIMIKILPQNFSYLTRGKRKQKLYNIKECNEFLFEFLWFYLCLYGFWKTFIFSQKNLKIFSIFYFYLHSLIGISFMQNLKKMFIIGFLTITTEALSVNSKAPVFYTNPKTENKGIYLKNCRWLRIWITRG